MCEFFIDTKGIEATSENILEENDSTRILESDLEENEGENVSEQTLIPLDALSELHCTTEKKRNAVQDEFSLNNTYLVTNYTTEGIQRRISSSTDKLLEKSTITPGFEKMLAVSVKKSRKALRRERKAIRDKTKGKDWYNLPATEITEEIQNDLDVLKMRSVLDSKHVYKKNDIKVTPKYFQIGKVVEGAADFYNGRIPKSQRKKTLVDELLADSSFKAYQKKKYKEIVDDSRRKKFRKVAFSERKSKKNYKEEWMSFD